MPDELNFFAQINFRDDKRTFGIKQEDRRRHMHIIGKTGTGKTTLLKNLIIQDIRAGRGVGVLDPHGDLIDELLNFIPKDRTNQTVYFSPADLEYPIGLNILEANEKSRYPLIASSIISIFHDLWGDSWGPRLEYILYNTVSSLLFRDPTTLLHIPEILEDENFRSDVILKLQDPVLKNFWKHEYEKWNDNFRREAVSPIQNKVGQLLTCAPLRNIFGQTKSKIDIRFMMDNKRILLCNLAKGKIGEDKTKILGSLIVMKFFLSALERIDVPEEKREDFYLYIDECQNLATGVFSSILSEARKYRLNLVLVHQYLDQLDNEIKKSILGNIGTLICFRLGSKDAKELESEFQPTFKSEDLENLGKYEIYLKLLVNGITSAPFSAKTLPLEEPSKKENNKENIIKVSREKYGVRREVVEDQINRFLNRKQEV